MKGEFGNMDKTEPHCEWRIERIVGRARWARQNAKGRFVVSVARLKKSRVASVARSKKHRAASASRWGIESVVLLPLYARIDDWRDRSMSVAVRKRPVRRYRCGFWWRWSGLTTGSTLISMGPAIVHRVCVYPLSIPLRRREGDTAATGTVVRPVVVAIELRDGTTGYGETVPQATLTGETVASAVEAVQSTFIPALLDFHPATFGEALEAVETLPWHDGDGSAIPAARAAVEMALLDAVLRFFQRDMDAAVQWMGLPGFGRPGSLSKVRFSGVIAQLDAKPAFRQLRRMYWMGMRHFKLKVGISGDLELVRRAAAYLRRPIERGRASLRVDARGAWSFEQLSEWFVETNDLPIAAIEQPLGMSVTDQLARWSAPRSAILWVHDESLMTLDDARRWIELGIAGGFNIGLSKCGGMLPSLRIAALARRTGVRIQLGCMVGETSILSAAGLRFLEVCPGVEWAEGCDGSLLRGDDVVARGLRFGYGGRPPRLRGAFGLSPSVDPGRLERLSGSKTLRVVL